MSTIIPTVSRNAFRRIVAPASRTALRHTSTMHDNDPEILEREKQKNLGNKQHRSSIPNAPGWNEHLASASEASVKADRHTGSPHEMQSDTVAYIKSRHSEPEPEGQQSEPLEPGVSTEKMKNGAGATEAQYSRDEVDGPLGKATVVETVEHTKEKVTRKFI